MDLSGLDDEDEEEEEGEIPITTTMIHDVPPPLPTDEEEELHHHIVPYIPKRAMVVRYKECLKNHAASIGGTATDGCGEFMPSGEEGTIEALKCSACTCHRNFHRREVEGDNNTNHYHHHHHRYRHQHDYIYKPIRSSAHKGLLMHYPSPMPLGAVHASESEEMPVAAKKRFRTKFTKEQKEKMLGFAERAGWRLQRQEEGAVQQFCQEIGIKRRVLKVWMHNNKHNLAKNCTPHTPPPTQLHQGFNIGKMMEEMKHHASGGSTEGMGMTTHCH